MFTLPAANDIEFLLLYGSLVVNKSPPTFPDILPSSLQQAATANTARMPRLGQQMLDSITFAEATPILQNF